MANHKPIGIFDSGIGGLTVASAISKLLPNEQLIYFGDTAHVPYGDKSATLIQSYALNITRFLLQQQCKALVIACNTASAAAYETLRDAHKGKVPVINVIDPMIEAVIADDEIKKVGIIATKATIASGVYQEKLTRRKPALKYEALATPLLASMIEEGFYNNNVSTAVLQQYLSHAGFADIDAMILACTHYPLIKPEIDLFFKHRIKIFDSAMVVAHKLQTILAKENLFASKRLASDIFYVSDFTKSFEESTKTFFGNATHLKQITI